MNRRKYPCVFLVFGFREDRWSNCYAAIGIIARCRVCVCSVCALEVFQLASWRINVRETPSCARTKPSSMSFRTSLRSCNPHQTSYRRLVQVRLHIAVFCVLQFCGAQSDGTTKHTISRPNQGRPCLYTQTVYLQEQLKFNSFFSVPTILSDESILNSASNTCV